MKKIFTLMAIVCLAMNGFAQDSTATMSDTTVKPDLDTIRVGNMIIVRSGKDRNRNYFDTVQHRFKSKNEKVTTNWFIVDLGVSQVNDKTNYPQAISQGFLPAGATENWFDQRNFKSTNVNIWVFVQRLSLISNVVNFKYGLGVELNNYKYKENIRFQETTSTPLVYMDVVDYKKNKLAADYITAPLLLNIISSTDPNHGFGVSAGISAGYLFSARQKTVGGGMGKKKYHDDFELRKFKLSYIAEVKLGPVKLYGSYATKSMFKKGLDMTPFNFGLRLSNW